MKRNIKSKEDVAKYLDSENDEFIERYSSYVEALPMEIF